MSTCKVKNLEGVLSQTIGKNIKIISEKSSTLTAPGEHYGSIMLALEVKYKNPGGKEEVLNLVAKLIPTDETIQEIFQTSLTFKKEIIAYVDAIPAIVELQKEYNIPDDKLHSNIFPKCYGGRVSLNKEKNEIDEDAVILLENLKVQGYETEDRLKGLDMQTTCMVLRSLARFHALPIALKQLKPKIFEDKVKPCLEPNRRIEELPPEISKSFYEPILNIAREIRDLDPYCRLLKELIDRALTGPFPPPNERWATMAHFDFWLSNAMFVKDQNGQCLKTKILDLQLMRYDSLCTDVVFFLFTSVQNDVLDKHFSEFLRIYYDAFIAALKDFDLDLKPFSWENFKKELDEVAPTQAYHILVMLKPICSERDGSADLSKSDSLGPTYKKKLRDTVLGLVKRKWL